MQVAEGNRRSRGNLLPQALAVSGFPTAEQFCYLRVMRIAVQPELHRQGIGKKLIAYVESSANADYMGSCFSAEPGTVRFWQQVGLQVIRVGIHKESSTGQYACIMLKSIDCTLPALPENIVAACAGDIGYQLLAQNNDMHPATALQILHGLPAQLCERDISRCRAYVGRQCSFETVQASLYRLFFYHACTNNAVTVTHPGYLLMTERLLQNQGWKTIAQRHGLAGRRAVEEILRSEFSLLLA